MIYLKISPLYGCWMLGPSCSCLGRASQVISQASERLWAGWSLSSLTCQTTVLRCLKQQLSRLSVAWPKRIANKETRQQIHSKCAFNGHSIKVKQNHIAKLLYVCVYIYLKGAFFKFHLDFIWSFLCKTFLKLQLTQNIHGLVTPQALQDEELTPHILGRVRNFKSRVFIQKLNTSHERHFQHKT